MTGANASTRSFRAGDEHRLRLVGARVVVVAGPDRGLEVAVGSGGVLVGSGSDCDLVLSDPLVSRRHVRITAEADGVRVEDLGSTNGTWFGGGQLGVVRLEGDAELSLGGTSLAVRLVQEALVVDLSSRTRFGDAFGASEAMRAVFALLDPASKTDVTVLLEGDSGVGKDVLARAIHAESPRQAGPFVVVDCGAIPATLLESELFGHEKGAFTGATTSRAGAFEQADGGTLFLDEIGELPLDQQPKLLRALEARSFRRVGGSRTIAVDVRVVAATNRRLREAVRRREFREDLFYRLAVVHVAVPPLSSRKDDIVPLAKAFLERQRPGAVLPPDLARLLVAYEWPGNARELRNVIDRFATFDRADPSLLFGEGGSLTAPRGEGGFDDLLGLPYHEAKKRLVATFHRRVLPAAVERAGGSVPKAADELEIPKASLYRMLKELEEEGGSER